MKTKKSACRKMTGQFKIFFVMIFLSGLYSCEMVNEIAPAFPDVDVVLKDGSILSESLDLVVSEPLDWAKGIGYWDFKLPMPKEAWNLLPERYLVVYAHGMVFPEPYEDIVLPDDEIGGKPVEEIVLEMGFAYATTSYTTNGLVAVEAVDNIKNLVQLLKKYMRIENLLLPDYWILAGPSEGGLVTVLTLEKYPQLFNGGLSICGPIGSMYDQMQYMGDLHVLFNYFFGDQLVGPLYIGNPEEGVPISAMCGWYNCSGIFDLKNTLGGLMLINPIKTTQMIYCSNSNLNPLDPTTGPALIHLLGYNIMLTNNVTEVLRGCIFNNIDRVYSGSLNDEYLNENIQRVYTKDFQRAKSFLNHNETEGNICVPLISMHNTGDYLVPYWHQEQYTEKISAMGNNNLFYGMTIDRFGHCEVTLLELQSAIYLLLDKINTSYF